MPGAGAKIQYTGKKEVQEREAQDKFEEVYYTHLKAESGGLKPNHQEELSFRLFQERMSSEVRNKGKVQQGWC